MNLKKKKKRERILTKDLIRVTGIYDVEKSEHGKAFIERSQYSLDVRRTHRLKKERTKKKTPIILPFLTGFHFTLPRVSPRQIALAYKPRSLHSYTLRTHTVPARRKGFFLSKF